ncbi:zinc finger BED domain-containing protein RICESLEEPER 3-like [Pistacia vera]|uniref:zinc finger BED domain-containing protein RICESLEEPER 3-like n=1 Tax=Pistacia vera TaxID=55513 RepID=UPI0012633F43|nr:zinc finger BED domain-containing protein RICESLEEPER 3-like [Pistacia vera]
MGTMSSIRENIEIEDTPIWRVNINRNTHGQSLEDEDPNFAIDLSHETPSADDWEKAIVFAKFLETFYEATKRMSGMKYVAFNNYFDEIVSIVFTLKDWENDPNPCLHNISKKMREKFDKYYGSLDKTNVMVLIATVLDHHVEQGQTSSSFPPKGTNQSSNGVVTSNATIKYHPFKDAFLEEMDVGLVDVNKSELEQYLKEKHEPMKCELSILDWWKANKGKYKSSLSLSVVQALVCSQDWLRCAPSPTPSKDYFVDAETYDLVLKAIDEESITTADFGDET